MNPPYYKYNTFQTTIKIIKFNMKFINKKILPKFKNNYFFSKKLSKI